MRRLCAFCKQIFLHTSELCNDRLQGLARFQSVPPASRKNEPHRPQNLPDERASESAEVETPLSYLPTFQTGTMRWLGQQTTRFLAALPEKIS